MPAQPFQFAAGGTKEQLTDDQLVVKFQKQVASLADNTKGRSSTFSRVSRGYSERLTFVLQFKFRAAPQLLYRAGVIILFARNCDFYVVGDIDLSSGQ